MCVYYTQHNFCDDHSGSCAYTIFGAKYFPRRDNVLQSHILASSLTLCSWDTLSQNQKVCIFSSEKHKIDYDVSNISDEQSTHTKCGRGGTKERNANLKIQMSRGGKEVHKPFSNHRHFAFLKLIVKTPQKTIKVKSLILCLKISV